MKRIAIVGGGISGLAAAFALEERRGAGEALEFVVYESGPRFGGVLFTEQVQGCLIEAGPDSFLTEKPWAADLCRRAGHCRPAHCFQRRRSQNLHSGEGQAVVHARWADVHGSDAAFAGVVDSAFFHCHEAACGA